MLSFYTSNSWKTEISTTNEKRIMEVQDVKCNDWLTIVYKGCFTTSAMNILGPISRELVTIKEELAIKLRPMSCCSEGV